MTCLKNEEKKTRCASCGKLGHSESQFIKKQKKEWQAFSVGPSPTVGDALLEFDSGPLSTEDVVPSVKRLIEDEAVKKRVRQAHESRSTSIPPREVRVTTLIPQVISKMMKSKRNIFKKCSDGCAATYGVLAELANASSSLAFGQLVHDDGNKAKANIRRLLSRGARVRTGSTTLVTAPKTRP